MRAGAYYNEIDPYAAQWLRNLIEDGLIAPGDVDTRSIVEVHPDDLKGYTQVHLFAGIGGWSFAARLAKWPDDKPLWTGSCPCQPFSSAGKHKGTADERHLWPDMRRLVEERRPPVVFGEQVASSSGRIWLAGVRTDLEALAYAVGAADLCSAGIGAPHIRQRLWWVAESDRGERDRIASREERFSYGTPARWKQSDCKLERGSSVSGMDYPAGSRWSRGHRAGQQEQGAWPRCSPGWTDFDLVHCTDGKARRFEPGSFPLAHGVSNRRGRLRSYGNAINPYLAAEFVAAYLESA